MKYTLSFHGIQAEVDSHGGELVSFRDAEGTEYIWNGDPAVWSGRNPLLFPIVGNLKEGAVLFDGERYEMSRHGFARDNEFTLVEQSEDRLVLELRESPATLSRYPYPFSLQVSQQLLENGFSTGFRVENTGSRPMPFCIGAHTAFRCPMREGESFSDYEIVFDQPEEASRLCLTEAGLLSHDGREPFLKGEDRFALDHELFARVDTVILENLRSRSIRLLHKKTRRGIRMEFAGFPMLAFWTKGKEKAPFICLEPWHGCAALDNESGEFRDKPRCITLTPGEVIEFQYKAFVE